MCIWLLLLLLLLLPHINMKLLVPTTPSQRQCTHPKGIPLTKTSTFLAVGSSISTTRQASTPFIIFHRSTPSPSRSTRQIPADPPLPPASSTTRTNSRYCNSSTRSSSRALDSSAPSSANTEQSLDTFRRLHCRRLSVVALHSSTLRLFGSSP